MKIAGLSPWGILIASIIYYFFEFGWFSYFQEAWQAGEGVVEAEYQGQATFWMPIGFLAPLLQVIAIGCILKWSGWPSMSEALGKIITLAILFGIAVSIYGLAYLPQHSISLFLIDSIHYLIGWSLATAILTYFRPKYMAPVKTRQTAADPEDIYNED